MITITEGNNELNIQLMPIGVVEFAYISDVRLIPITYLNHSYYRLEIDVQNVGEISGVCHAQVYERANDTRYNIWSSWKNTSDWGYVLELELRPIETGTFSCRVDDDVASLRYQYRIESEAGIIYAGYEA